MKNLTSTILIIFVFLFLPSLLLAEDNFKNAFEDDVADGDERFYIMHFALNNKAVSTLFVGPTGKMMLFDVGRCPEDADEIIERVEHVENQEPYARNSEFSPYVDRIVISHQHSDHNGDKKCGESKKGYKHLIDELNFNESDLEYPDDFEKGQSWIFDIDEDNNPIVMTVLATDGYVIGESSRIYDSGDPNTTSITLLVTYKDFVYYVGGDLTGGGYQASEPSTYTLDLESAVGEKITSFVGNAVDVVQVNHHGSSTSSNHDFLSAVFPDNQFRNAIINVSEGYTCLPERSTVERILSYIHRDSSQTYGHTHLWQTQDGGDGEGKPCDPGVSSEINSKHSIENRNVWIRTNGANYSIRSLSEGGHSHTYESIPIATAYPLSDGSLITSINGNAVYVIEGETKRPFVSADIFNTCGYDWNKILKAEDSLLDYYPQGEAINSIDDCYSAGVLFKAESGGAVYRLNSAGEKRGIVSADIFNACGYDWNSIHTFPDDVVSNTPTGNTINSLDDCRSPGFLFKATNRGTVYRLNSAGEKRGIVSADIFNACGYSWNSIHTLADGVVSNLPTGNTINSLDDCRSPGFLFKTSSSGTVYVMGSSGEKRGIVSANIFNACGYNWNAIYTLADSVVNNLTTGRVVNNANDCP